MKKRVVCQEKGPPLMIDLNQTCFAKSPIVNFRKNELRKAVVSFTPLEIMLRSVSSRNDWNF